MSGRGGWAAIGGLLLAAVSAAAAGNGKRGFVALAPPEPLSRRLPALGVNASLNGKRVFPSRDLWNQRIDREPVDPASEAILASVARSSRLHAEFGPSPAGIGTGIAYVVVPGTQPRVPIQFTSYADESDPGPYPVPLNAPIEGGPNSDGDRRVIVVDRDNWKLYELWRAFPHGNGFRAGSGAMFDLTSGTIRPAGWASADAAGLPIFPGLVRWDEVAEQKAIHHALRFTLSRTRRAYVAPARRSASHNSDTNLAPMGMRVRLKASVDISHVPPQARTILRALKTYGMFLADNGSDWGLSGTADPRWNEEDLGSLRKISPADLEVVRMGNLIAR